MRALHVAAGNLYGGVERILVEIARARTAAWRHEFALCFEGRLLGELQDARTTPHLLGPVRFSRPTTIWRARRRLRQLWADGRFDALVCHSPWAFALAAPATPGRRILWAHDALRGSHWTERRAARTIPDLVICNSRYTADAVAGWLVNAPLEIVYAPVSPGIVPASARHDVRRELGVKDGTTVIVIACRFERWKGHRELLQAASALRGDWVVWVVGGAQRPHEAELERELRTLVEQRRIGDRVRFLGERRDVPWVLRGADIHCQPNIEPEPFGVAFVEALYAGLPVVTSDAGGAREIVTETCGVLVPPGDVSLLQSALQSLIDDPGRRTAFGSVGPSRAHALSNPVAQIAALERVLTPHAAVALA